MIKTSPVILFSTFAKIIKDILNTRWDEDPYSLGRKLLAYTYLPFSCRQEEEDSHITTWLQLVTKWKQIIHNLKYKSLWEEHKSLLELRNHKGTELEDKGLYKKKKTLVIKKIKNKNSEQ